MKPSVGQIVHYVSYGTPGGEYSRACRAAIVTEVTSEIAYSEGAPDPVIGLCVLSPEGLFFNRGVRPGHGRSDDAGGTNLCGRLDFRGGTWHWPAREPV